MVEREKVAEGNAVDCGVLQEAARNVMVSNQKNSFFIARIVMLLDYFRKSSGLKKPAISGWIFVV